MSKERCIGRCSYCDAHLSLLGLLLRFLKEWRVSVNRWSRPYNELGGAIPAEGVTDWYEYKEIRNNHEVIFIDRRSDMAKADFRAIENALIYEGMHLTGISESCGEVVIRVPVERLAARLLKKDPVLDEVRIEKQIRREFCIPSEVQVIVNEREHGLRLGKVVHIEIWPTYEGKYPEGLVTS